MNIPLLDLKKEYAFLKKDIDAQLQDCFQKQDWILGAKVQQLEDKLKAYLGVKFCVGVNSGTDALVIALSALALKLRNKEFFNKEDEIITTPWTFIATAEAIVRAGATAVFVDIDPDTFNISPQAIKQAVTKNTVGIIPVHLYGLSCDMEIIQEIAEENNLFVLEDTAQAFGAEFKGRKAGTMGTLGSFSFFPSKNLGGFGDGGLVAANDEKLAGLVKVLRNHGQFEKYNAEYIGYNSRLDNMQAAIVLAKLKYIDEFNRRRIAIAQKYNAAFSSIEQIKIPEISLNTQYSRLNTKIKHVYHLYTIKVSSRRDEFLEYLNAQGICSRIYYPVLLHKMKAFKDCSVSGGLEHAEYILGKVITLPLHPFLEDAEVDYVIRAVYGFFKHSK